jgi:hypothetical protein
MNYIWSITETQAQDGLILCAKYHVTAKEDDLSVETEGYWTFDSPKLSIPFDQVTEEMIVGWIKSEAVRDGKNMIESRLAEQIDNLAIQAAPSLPWMPQVFTPKFEE